MIEAEEARLKAEIDGIVAKINATMQNIESVITEAKTEEETKSEDRADNRLDPT